MEGEMMDKKNLKSYLLNEIPIFYSEKDVYERCGHTKNNYRTAMVFKEEFHVMPDGVSIPIIQYPHSWDGLRTKLVLKTFKGYIPVEDIQSWDDIFNEKHYLKDDTEWIYPYEAGRNQNYDIQLQRFIKRVGKHWKGSSYESTTLKKSIK